MLGFGVRPAPKPNSSQVCAVLIRRAVLFVLWLIIEYWMWILPITLIGAILYYFGTKEDS